MSCRSEKGAGSSRGTDMAGGDRTQSGAELPSVWNPVGASRIACGTGKHAHGFMGHSHRDFLGNLIGWKGCLEAPRDWEDSLHPLSHLYKLCHGRNC